MAFKNFLYLFLNLRYLKKNKGFTFIEIIVATSLISLILLAITQMVILQSKQMDLLIAENSTQDLINTLTTFLENPTTCSEILSNLQYSSSNNTSLLPIIVPKSSGTPSINIAQGGSFYDLKILEIALDKQNFFLDVGNVSGLVGSPSYTYLTNIILTVSPLSDVSSKFKISRKIPISFSTNASNVIISCLRSYPINSNNPLIIKDKVMGFCPNAVAAYQTLSCPPGMLIRSVEKSSVVSMGPLGENTYPCSNNPYECNCKCCPNIVFIRELCDVSATLLSLGQSECPPGHAKYDCQTCYSPCSCPSVSVDQITCY